MNRKVVMKKITPIMLLILMIINLIMPIQIFAASGTGTWKISEQYNSSVKTTDYSTSSIYGIMMRNITNIATGEEITAFCAEHGIDLVTGGTYSGEYYTPTNPALKYASKIAYFGWYVKYGKYSDFNQLFAHKYDYVFTQQFIWEYLGQTSSTFRDSNIQSQYEAYKSTIISQINNMQTRPSFDATSIELNVGETKVITDSNGVLALYKSINVTHQGINFTHNYGENTLSITVNNDCTMERINITDVTTKSWGLIKDGTEDKDTTIYFNFPDNSQDQLYSLNFNDPIPLAFNLKINLLGNLELNKLNANGDLIDGAIFNVTGPNGFNQDVRVTNGKIVLESIKSGTYTIKEKSAGIGYLINPNTYTVTVNPNETTTQAIVNNEPTGELSLIKTDIDVGTDTRIDGTIHHGDTCIEGAVYTLYADEDIYNASRTVKYFSVNDEIATFTFNKNGIAIVNIVNNSTKVNLDINGTKLTGLPLGNYYSKETVAPNGYTLDANKYKYNFSYKDENTKVITKAEIVSNTVQKAPFEVIKVSTNNNSTAKVIEGAEFTAILSKYVDYYGSFDEAKKHLSEFATDEYSIFKTGTNGHGISDLLAYGEYTVNETYTPSSEINTVEEFYVTIDRDSKTPIKELVENDLPFEAYIKLIKVDKDTGRNIIYSHATFKLYKLNENTNEWEVVNCKVGNNYYSSWSTNSEGIAITETKLSAGKYRIEEIEVPNGYIQNSEELIFNINNRNKTLEYDKDYDAWITVNILNEKAIGSLNITKTINLREDVDTSLIKDIDFTKISFELVAKEDIIDSLDGSVIYSKNTVIGKYNLNEKGNLAIENIQIGKYYLKEITTIDGLVLDSTEHSVEFKQEDKTTKTYVLDIDIENKATLVEVSKKSITGDEELEGAKLSILDKDGNVIDSWVSTNKPHIVEGLVIGQTYTLKEDLAPLGFAKATEIKFEVRNTSEIQQIVMIDKLVGISKTDLTNGKELEGAKLVVTDENGSIIEEWISTTEIHYVSGLEEGKTYILTEITAPYGYEIAESITFTVTTDKETQIIKMKDKPILKTIKVQKLDSDTEENIKLNNFEFAIFEDKKCTKLINIANTNIIDGTATFASLRYGIYYIKETKAPMGYQLSDEIVKIEINENGVFANDVELLNNEETYSFNYYNSKVPETPIIQTGNETNYTLLFSLIGISLIGIIVGFIFIKRGAKNNK